MLKKFISLIMAASMCLSLAFAMPASANGLTKDDIIEEAGLLQKLGIITSIVGEESGNSTITRAEFAVTVANMLGLGDFKSANRYFIDVPEDHWAANAINALTERGVLSQPADRIFRIYDNITVNEALKMLLSVCGYSKYADALGGYPKGYMEISGMLEMDITPSAEPMTHYQSYKLLYEALMVRLYEVKDGNTFGFTMTQSDETFLSQYFDVYQTTGLITQAHGISLYPEKYKKGDSEESATYVVMDDVIYTSEIDLYDYLGRFTTVFYVQEDVDDTPHIIYRETYRKEGDVLEVKAEDFVEYKNNSFYYTPENSTRDKYEKVDDGVIIIKNGELCNTNINEAIKISKGSYRLIDRDEDNAVDYIIISEYENIVVNVIDSENFNVYDKIKKDKFINLDTREKMVFIEDNAGAVKSFADITTSSVLTVFDSAEYVRVIINAPAVSTNVYSTKAENDEFMVELGKSELDRTWYTIDKDYYNAVFADNGYGEVRLATGNAIEYYTDAFGNIAYIAEPLKDNWGYAYLIKVLNNEDTDCAIFKLFTQNNEMLTCQVSEKVRIDGEKAQGYDQLTAKLDKVANYGKTLQEGEDRVNGQVIRVKLNADNEIVGIDTERKTDSEEKYTLQRTLDYAKYGHWWHAGGFPSAKAYYGSNTIKFCVPVFSAQATAEEKFFSVRTSKYNDTGTSEYTIEAFKTDLSSPYAAVITDYIEITSDKAKTTEAAYLVDKVTTEVNKDDEVVYVLSAYATTSGDLVSYSSDSPETFVGLSKGDLVQLKVDALGNTVGYNMLYDYQNTENKVQWGHITNNGSWRESDRYYDLIHTYVKTNQESMLRLIFESALTPADMEYENLDICDRFVGFNGKGPMLIFDGKNVTVTTLAEGILSAEITGTDNLEDYWFSVFLAKIVSGVVYRDAE